MNRTGALLLALVMAMGISLQATMAVPANAEAQQGFSTVGWAQSATVADLTGNSKVSQSEALVAGHSYNVTMHIVVPITQAGVRFQTSLNVKLGQAPNQAQFWQVRSPTYGGYNGSSFTVGSRVVSFNQVAGDLALSAYFQIPVNFTLSLNGTRDLPQNGVTLISIVPVGGSEAGHFAATVQDQTIQKYLATYNNASALVPSGKIPKTYEGLVNNILVQSQALYALGLPDQGTKLLNTLVPSYFPAPPDASLMNYLLVGLAASIIVVVLLAVLMLRGRGKQGYSAGVVGEVQKDLAVLEVTAAKYDKALADRLKSLRDKLGEIS